MSHKVHPKAFRIKEMSDWQSVGFYNKNIPKYLEEDFHIREILGEKLKDCGIEEIKIERFADKLNIVIASSRPGLVIGRGGSGIEETKKYLQKELLRRLKKRGKAGFPTIKIEIKEIRDIWANPYLVAEWVAQRLQKRMNHRKVMKQALSKISSMKNVKGSRIELSGRLNGAEISRREWLKQGNLPRQTIRSDIRYAFGEARCSYGVIGIKVWIYMGEKFENKEEK
jgi:small subunit ribosomal protein S3